MADVLNWKILLIDDEKDIREVLTISLRDAGFTTRLDWILSAEIPDVPGGLLKAVAKPLADAGVNLKYCYAYIEQTGGDKAMVVLKVDDIEKAEQVLKAL